MLNNGEGGGEERIIIIIIIIIIILNSSKTISGQETKTNVGFVIWFHITSLFPESPSPPIKTLF